MHENNRDLIISKQYTTAQLTCSGEKWEPSRYVYCQLAADWHDHWVLLRCCYLSVNLPTLPAEHISLHHSNAADIPDMTCWNKTKHGKAICQLYLKFQIVKCEYENVHKALMWLTLARFIKSWYKLNVNNGSDSWNTFSNTQLKHTSVSTSH